jgi:Mce-associated membrane protein
MESAEDATDGQATEQHTSTAVTEKSPRTTSRRWLAAVAAVAVLVGVGYAGWALVTDHQTDAAEAQAVDAAEKYALKLINFDSDSDSTTVDANMNDLLEGSTGEFKQMYSRSRGQLLQLQVENNASARGTVVDTAVKSATKHEVVVVLFVDQSVTNHGDLDDADIDRSRIKMTMQKVHGRWLVSKVELR